MTSDPVKGPSGGRGDQARATRQRIVDAAATLFVEKGYPATTLTEVAARAGVAVQTLYFHLGNKRTLLKAAVDVAAVGDDAPVAVLDRPWMDELRAEPDPARMVALWVRASADIFVRVAPIMAVVRDAAATDTEMAEQWAVNEAQRLTAYGVFAQLLADRHALKPGLSVGEATDLVFALNSIEVYLLLTATRGWTPERWEHWLTPTLAASLLR